MDKSKVERIKELVKLLNEASVTYYNTGDTIMTDSEYDKLYDELKQLEYETNTVLSNSPTQKVGAEVISKLETVKHNHPMLSLDKCHTSEELIEFAGDRDCLLMLKLDGLTVSLEYNYGKLISAETRGTGEEGSNILHNAFVFKNIPKGINCKEHLIVDGEAIITYDDFNKINDSLGDDEKYKNPRNLASGSCTLLDSKEASKRNLRFIAWKVIKGLDEISNPDSNFFKLKEVERLGFDVVPMWTYSNKSSDKDNLPDMLSNLRVQAEKLGYPIDGAVMLTDSITVGNEMGRTEKFFRHSIAYKFEDEDYATELLDIEWTMGKTGVLTPTVIFKSVLIDGTSVSRASLHNVSIMEELDLQKGCTVNVYKANCIIPQVRSAGFNGNEIGEFIIPNKCPICGGKTEIRMTQDPTMGKIVKTLYCTNENCKGKLLGKLNHFVSKYAMNIDGLSESTLERFMDLGWLNGFTDIYNLPMRKEIVALDGFGKKSFDKLCKSIETSRYTTLQRLIYSLSIPNVGKDASKKISNKCKGEYEAFVYLINNKFNWGELECIGDVINQSIYNYFSSSENKLSFVMLKERLEIESNSTESNVNNNGVSLNGLTFVITGSVTHFKNRDEVKAKIESLGGKVSGSVSAKTSYLINNDIASTSGKNKDAKKLNVPIITEEQFLAMINK